MRHAANADLWTAAWLSADGVGRGRPLHLHAEGPRGTGKTTVLRHCAALLPRITRVRGCPYNCDPGAPHCPLHAGLAGDALAALGTERVPAPFLELAASAKLATAVGTIDLARLLDPDRPEAALLPGTLARAHRGVVFVDEINRLADVAPELADALLDVMGTRPGRLQVEEAGLPPVVLPLSATVWAASNPDEEPGPLDQTRLQLADRFDLRVAVRPPEDAAAVLAVLRGLAGAPAEPLPPPGGGAPVAWPEARLRFLADFYLRVGLGSLRALQAWQHAAEGLARRDGRQTVSAEDVRVAARLTLHGRVDPEAAEAGLRGLAVAGAPPAGGAPAAEPAGEAGAAEETADGPPGEGERGAVRTEAASPAARPIAAIRPLVQPQWTGAAAEPPAAPRGDPG